LTNDATLEQIPLVCEQALMDVLEVDRAEETKRPRITHENDVATALLVWSTQHAFLQRNRFPIDGQSKVQFSANPPPTGLFVPIALFNRVSWLNVSMFYLLQLASRHPIFKGWDYQLIFQQTREYHLTPKDHRTSFAIQWKLNDTVPRPMLDVWQPLKLTASPWMFDNSKRPHEKVHLLDDVKACSRVEQFQKDHYSEYWQGTDVAIRSQGMQFAFRLDAYDRKPNGSNGEWSRVCRMSTLITLPIDTDVRAMTSLKFQWKFKSNKKDEWISYPTTYYHFLPNNCLTHTSECFSPVTFREAYLQKDGSIEAQVCVYPQILE